MKFDFDQPDYNPERGLILKWEPGAIIATGFQGKAIRVRANRAGLISLAYHLLALAQIQVPIGEHIHYDDSNSLETGSIEVIIERT